MAWAVEAVADYVDNVRPRFGAEDHPAMWVTERGRADKAGGDQRPLRHLPRRLGSAVGSGAAFAAALYVTHLKEDGADRRFIQVQVGHECDSSTAIYTHVSDDFMNRALRKALSRALDDDDSEEGRQN